MAPKLDTAGKNACATINCGTKPISQNPCPCLRIHPMSSAGMKGWIAVRRSRINRGVARFIKSDEREGAWIMAEGLKSLVEFG